MSQVVLYHGNCYDGFCAAWVLKRNHWPDATYMPISYGDPVPWEEIDGNDVIVVDFSFKRDVMLEVIRRANDCVVLDHHKTAEVELEGIPECVFHMHKSGGRLAWEHCSSGPAPKLVQYTEDRDLWRFGKRLSREVNMAIRSYPMDFETWDALERTFDAFGDTALVDEGAAILRFQEQYFAAMKALIRRVFVPAPLDGADGFWVPCVNAPYFSISDLLNSICEEEQEAGRPPIAMGWYQSKDGSLIYSLRSKGEIDVSEPAAHFGGGGHKNAAGFSAIDFVWTKVMLGESIEASPIA